MTIANRERAEAEAALADIDAGLDHLKEAGNRFGALAFMGHIEPEWPTEFVAAITAVQAYAETLRYALGQNKEQNANGN